MNYPLSQVITLPLILEADFLSIGGVLRFMYNKQMLNTSYHKSIIYVIIKKPVTLENKRVLDQNSPLLNKLSVIQPTTTEKSKLGKNFSGFQ